MSKFIYLVNAEKALVYINVAHIQWIRFADDGFVLTTNHTNEWFDNKTLQPIFKNTWCGGAADACLDTIGIQTGWYEDKSDGNLSTILSISNKWIKLSDNKGELIINPICIISISMLETHETENKLNPDRTKYVVRTTFGVIESKSFKDLSSLF